VNSIEDLIKPLLGGVLEVKDQRKDELMVDITKY